MTSLVTSSHSTASGKAQLTSDVMPGSSKFNSMDIYLRKEDCMSGQPQLYRANCGKIFMYKTIKIMHCSPAYKQYQSKSWINYPEEA
jgi:hypothetical protein